tara:strand:- start:874 stop:1692 length:819 start_codon:yes stop_codon:yes gene_type:complete
MTSEGASMTHTIAVCNRKGGVGKTTVAVNLASAFAQRGHRVLVIDMDSQASATDVLLEPSTERLSTAHVLAGVAKLSEVLVESTRPGVWVAPASSELTHAQLAIVSKPGRETILRRALREVDGFDVILIDAAPEQQLGTVNALVASTHVLMPWTPDPVALKGMGTTWEAIAEINEAELSDVQLLGCVQIAFDKRLKITHEAREQVASAYGALLCDTVIRTNTNFFVCPAWHQDIFAIEKKERGVSKGSEDFLALSEELALRLNLKKPLRTAA